MHIAVLQVLGKETTVTKEIIFVTKLTE